MKILFTEFIQDFHKLMRIQDFGKPISLFNCIQSIFMIPVINRIQITMIMKRITTNVK